MSNSSPVNSLKKLKDILTVVGNLHGNGFTYEVFKEIGRGAYGVVYECRDVSTNRNVAIKAVEHKYGNNEREAFDSLHDADGKCNHLVEVLNGLTNDTLACLVYPIYGPNLSKAMEINKQPFKAQEVRIMAKQLIEAVNFLHKNGMLHCDIKPENILLNRLVGHKDFT